MCVSVTEDPNEAQVEPEVSTDRVARDVSLVVRRGKIGFGFGDHVHFTACLRFIRFGV